MRTLLAAGAMALCIGTAASPSRAADTTTMLAYTFGLTFAGAGAGAVLAPYAFPVVAPAASAVYGTVAGIGSGLATTTGAWLLAEPRLTGAIIGMTGGLFGGLTAFGGEEPKKATGPNLLGQPKKP